MNFQNEMNFQNQRANGMSYQSNQMGLQNANIALNGINSFNGNKENFDFQGSLISNEQQQKSDNFGHIAALNQPLKVMKTRPVLGVNGSVEGYEEYMDWIYPFSSGVQQPIQPNHKTNQSGPTTYMINNKPVPLTPAKHRCDHCGALGECQCCSCLDANAIWHTKKNCPKEQYRKQEELNRKRAAPRSSSLKREEEAKRQKEKAKRQKVLAKPVSGKGPVVINPSITKKSTKKRVKSTSDTPLILDHICKFELNSNIVSDLPLYSITSTGVVEQHGTATIRFSKAGVPLLFTDHKNIKRDSYNGSPVSSSPMGPPVVDLYTPNVYSDSYASTSFDIHPTGDDNSTLNNRFLNDTVSTKRQCLDTNYSNNDSYITTSTTIDTNSTVNKDSTSQSMVSYNNRFLNDSLPTKSFWDNMKNYNNNDKIKSNNTKVNTINQPIISFKLKFCGHCNKGIPIGTLLDEHLYEMHCNEHITTCAVEHYPKQPLIRRLNLNSMYRSPEYKSFSKPCTPLLPKSSTTNNTTACNAIVKDRSSCNLNTSSNSTYNSTLLESPKRMKLTSKQQETSMQSIDPVNNSNDDLSERAAIHGN